MSEIYLNHASVSLFASLQTNQARPRFIEYYRDLYALSKKNLDETTFTQGDQYNFAQLGRGVLDSCQVDGFLNDADTLICTTWSHEFDPDHSSSGPYFSERYKIPNVFDVCDQGSITPFMGLKILISYLKSGQSKQAVLLGLEQNSIPRNLDDNVVIPVMSGSGALIFSFQEDSPKDYPSIRLVSADVLNENEVLKNQHDASELVKKKIDLLGINKDEITLVMKKSSTLWKAYRKFKHEKSVIDLHPSMSVFDNSVGTLPFFCYMTALTNMQLGTSRYIAILDEDVESLSIGIAIFEVKK